MAANKNFTSFKKYLNSSLYNNKCSLILFLLRVSYFFFSRNFCETATKLEEYRNLFWKKILNLPKQTEIDWRLKQDLHEASISQIDFSVYFAPNNSFIFEKLFASPSFENIIHISQQTNKSLTHKEIHLYGLHTPTKKKMPKQLSGSNRQL